MNFEVVVSKSLNMLYYIGLSNLKLINEHHFKTLTADEGQNKYSIYIY